jgi:hypothetical protein
MQREIDVLLENFSGAARFYCDAAKYYSDLQHNDAIYFYIAPQNDRNHGFVSANRETICPGYRCNHLPQRQTRLATGVQGSI